LLRKVHEETSFQTVLPCEFKLTCNSETVSEPEVAGDSLIKNKQTNKQKTKFSRTQAVDGVIQNRKRGVEDKYSRNYHCRQTRSTLYLVEPEA
jgi:hypothetical protein